LAPFPQVDNSLEEQAPPGDSGAAGSPKLSEPEKRLNWQGG